MISSILSCGQLEAAGAVISPAQRFLAKTWLETLLVVTPREGWTRYPAHLEFISAGIIDYNKKMQLEVSPPAFYTLRSN